MYSGYITDIDGIEVGHYTDSVNKTGLTAVIARKGAVCGCDVRGGAPGTRETALTRPGQLVKEAHAVVLSGGSAFGLASASGVMDELERQGIGLDMGVAKVPIVLGAVLYDLEYGSANVRPTYDNGVQAVLNASSLERGMGNIGAGTGATAGKLLGMSCSQKCGLGSACIDIGGGVKVAAIVAVNALGDVYDEQGNIICGAKSESGYINTERAMLTMGAGHAKAGGNTTIGIVATNAKLNKEQANKMASIAHNGYALAIRPVHTMFDGDTVFTLATCEKEADENVLYAAAQTVMRYAIINAALSSK
ncbi:MAG: P1 family peptidase [Christensenellaceae bacterium]|nr:P1 family peptidase [Christensenellaceae bacterium]